MQELIKTHKNIMQDSTDEKAGDITAQQFLSKLFKPLTEKIVTTTKAIKALPTLKAITLPPNPSGLPATEANPNAPNETTTELGEIATAYFNRSLIRLKTLILCLAYMTGG